MVANDMRYASWWFCNTDDPLRAVDLAIKDRDIMRVNQWIIEVGLFKNGGYSNLSMSCNKFLGWNRIIICNYQFWDNSISQMWIGIILVNIYYNIYIYIDKSLALFVTHAVFSTMLVFDA